jgi:hypothetical protein
MVNSRTATGRGLGGQFRASQAAGVILAIRLIGKLAKPDKIEPRYSRIGVFNCRQASTTEIIGEADALLRSVERSVLGSGAPRRPLPTLNRPLGRRAGNTEAADVSLPLLAGFFCRNGQRTDPPAVFALVLPDGRMVEPRVVERLKVPTSASASCLVPLGRSRRNDVSRGAPLSKWVDCYGGDRAQGRACSRTRRPEFRFYSIRFGKPVMCKSGPRRRASDRYEPWEGRG